MMEINIDKADLDRYPRPLDMNLVLKTIKGTKSSMGRVVKEYTKGRVEHSTMKNLTNFFNSYISILRLEADLRIEERIKDLESKLNDNSKIG